MSTEDNPTPPALAEVCERLRTHISFMAAIGPLDSIGYDIATNMRAALLLIEQGEKERERLNAENNDMAYRLGEATRGLEWQPTVKDLRAQLAAATERVQRLDEFRQFVQSFGDYWKAFEARAARAQPTPESK